MLGKSIVVKRSESHYKNETKEIEKLAESAGYTVEEILTQSRKEDSEYNIGKGKLKEVYNAVQNNSASTVIIDNELDPYQMYNIGIYLPNDIDIKNRYTLILDLFEQRAETRKSQQQVKLAKLRYELPRAETKIRLSKREEHPGFMGLGDYDTNQVKSIKNQIKKIKRELSKIEYNNKKRREIRRENGFDLISIAGYTNAGKSTLFRRLSEKHSVDENEKIHNDLKPTAKSTDNYFTTLDTTTRRMKYDKRKVLVTDTVGFVNDLPHWLFDAFNSTFDSIYQSDLTVLVVDITNDINEIIKRIAISHDYLTSYGKSRIITVFNKCDEISHGEIQRKAEAVKSLAPNPVIVSAINGTNIDDLKDRIHRSLPPFEEDVIQLPLTPESMSIVSWLYENAHINICDYTPSGIIIDYEARESIIQKTQSKINNIQPRWG